MCIERAETVFEERVADDDVRLRVPPPMSSRAFGQFWRTEIFLTIRVNGLVELEVIEDLLEARPSWTARECCKLAESHGYEWLWIDTCCIDRSSSAELSEAVNSMFSWYSHAHVCYAYLFDVPGWGSLARRNSPFRLSKWFTRGWTLQELVPPRSPPWPRFWSRSPGSTPTCSRPAGSCQR